MINLHNIASNKTINDDAFIVDDYALDHNTTLYYPVNEYYITYSGPQLYVGINLRIFPVDIAFKWRGTIYFSNQYASIAGTYYVACGNIIRLIYGDTLENAAYKHCGDEVIVDNIRRIKIYRGEICPNYNCIYSCNTEIELREDGNFINTATTQSILCVAKTSWVTHIIFHNNFIIIKAGCITYIVYKLKYVGGELYRYIITYHNGKLILYHPHTNKILMEHNNKLYQSERITIFELPMLDWCNDSVKYILQLKCSPTIKYSLIEGLIRLQSAAKNNI